MPGLLLRNSASAAAATRSLNNEQLDRVALASLYTDIPTMYQFMLGDHSVRHSFLSAVSRTNNQDHSLATGR